MQNTKTGPPTSKDIASLQYKLRGKIKKLNQTIAAIECLCIGASSIILYLLYSKGSLPLAKMALVMLLSTGIGVIFQIELDPGHRPKKFGIICASIIAADAGLYYSNLNNGDLLQFMVMGIKATAPFVAIAIAVPLLQNQATAAFTHLTNLEPVSPTENAELQEFAIAHPVIGRHIRIIQAEKRGPTKAEYRMIVAYVQGMQKRLPNACRHEAVIDMFLGN